VTRARRFARNVGWSLGGQAGIVLVNFFTIPYLLRGFGSEAYGVYLLMYAVANCLPLFQFGSGMATIKYVAEAQAAGEDGALRDALRHSAAIYFSGIGAAAAVLYFAAGPLSSRVFDVPVYYRVYALWLLRAAAVGGFFAAGVQWIAAVFQGLQRFAWPSALTLLQSLLLPLGLYAVLALGRGLGAAAAWYVFVQVLIFSLGVAILGAALSKHRGTGGSLDFRRFARYGLSFWPAALAGVASSQIDKAFVAGMLNMSELTFYTVPAGVLQRLQVLPQTISHALMPMLTEAGRIEGREELVRLYLRSSRVLLALSIPALGLLFALIPQLLGLWLTPQFSAHAATAARLLVASQAFALAFHAPYALAGGLGGGRDTSVYSWTQALLSLALWPFLIPRWGISGAAAGALVAQALPTIIYINATHRRLLGLSWERFAREALAPLAAPTSVLLALAWFARGLAWTWPGFIGVNAAAGAAYAGLLWRALPEEDRGAARRWLERG